ncbi:MAG: zinc ribbon domain-containing protein [Blastocatellia bacterium]|nr:zinc ribbon domain-containing protein [Blastocatellia bacterium]
MYCPNCATPIDGVKFCRVCGANVSMVPQAMTGELPQEDESSKGRHRRHAEKEPSIEKAATTFFTGIGFILAALAILFYFPAGWAWGWSFFIPAFACIGQGVGAYLRIQEDRRREQQALQARMAYVPAPVFPAAPQPGQLSAPTTSNLHAPGSIAEPTTRHLDAVKPKE